MDWGGIINVVFGAIMSLGAWLWKGVVSDIKDLDEKHEQLKKEVYTAYTPKLDLQRFEDKITTSINSMGTDIKRDLAAISIKLDTKQDKHN